MSNIAENKPHYLGHRQRLRNRYIENGIESLLEHEVVELILFYSIPRVDTKPLAHKLIDAYGSLEGVLCASYESLREFGLSENSAVLLTMFAKSGEWIRRKNVHGMNIEKYDEIGQLLVGEFDGCSAEKLVMLLLDAKNNVIELKTVCEGSFKGTQVNMKAINDEVVLRKAAKVVLAHNHPSGKLDVSTDDIVSTDAVESFLECIGVELVEHYVIADGTYLGIKRQENDHEKERELLYKNGFGRGRRL